MKRIRSLLLMLACCAVLTGVNAAAPAPIPEFTHHSAEDWVNSDPLTLAGLRGKVVMVEFWAFDCVNCLNSRPWIDSLLRDKSPAGLVIVSVHTPELREEESRTNVRRAVERLNIHNPVMMDQNKSYWYALRNQAWPTYYLIGRDGLLYGSVRGEMHVGDPNAKRVEAALDQLLAARTP
jgi:thiol-disulfide isomerase/thioredoxin